MEKYAKYINKMKKLKNISYVHYFVPIGITLTILGCFSAMVVGKVQGNPAKFYGDFFHNGFWGNIADLTYRMLSGNDGKPRMNTVGIFSGTLRCSKQAGISLIAWGAATIFFYKKDKLLSGLMTACPFFVMNIILLIYFRRFKGDTSQFTYMTSTYSYGMGYKLFILGALLILIGGILTYKSMSFDVPYHFRAKKTRKVVLYGWGLVAFLYLCKFAVPDIVITTIFNGVGLYLVIPCLRGWSNSDII